MEEPNDLQRWQETRELIEAALKGFEEVMPKVNTSDESIENQKKLLLELKELLSSLS